MSQTTDYRNALPAGTQLAEYRLESVLGAGGFGITYLARDTHLEKLVAIKEYLPGDIALRALDGSIVPVSTDAEHDYRWGLERFIQEARTLARFSHPNIVRVNRYFEEKGTGYMVMDYEEGESLGQYLRREPRPEEGALRALLAPLLDGLRAVHAAGFLHRDIKPSNIFLRTGGSPVLLDFGSARLASGSTRSLTAIVTPGFAPIEQYANDGHQGPWSDIYAMAAVLFRAVTGETPPDAVTRMRADNAMAALDRARDRYSEPLLRAIKWAMAIEEKARPQSVAEWEPAVLEGQPAPRAAPSIADAPTVPLADAATLPLAKAPAAAREPTQRVASPNRRPAPPPERGKSRWRWVGVAAVIVIVVAVAGAWNRQRAAEARIKQEAARAEQERLSAARAAALEADRRSAAEERARAEAELRRIENEGTFPKVPADEPKSALRERPSRDRETRPADASPSDLERLKRALESDFRAADSNGDGYLSRDEAQRRFPFAARQFERIDTDGDGRISQEEFWRMRRAQIERKAR